jgi:hypothetical protein
MDMIVVPNKPIETKIIVQTRLGNDIPNRQSHEYSSFEERQFFDLESKHPKAEPRTPPNPIYNCHGLTFASNRTGIDESAILQFVLNDDGYKEVNRDQVLPGDIILYFTEGGDVEHSGIVVSKPDDFLMIPRVVSKWGKYKEFTHLANDCPYSFAYVKYYRVTEWD